MQTLINFYSENNGWPSTFPFGCYRYSLEKSKISKKYFLNDSFYLKKRMVAEMLNEKYAQYTYQCSKKYVEIRTIRPP